MRPFEYDCEKLAVVFALNLSGTSQGRICVMNDRCCVRGGGGKQGVISGGCVGADG